MECSRQKSSYNYLSLSAKIRKAVKVHPVNLAHCAHEEIYAKMDQIVDPSHPLHDVHEVHCYILEELLRLYAFGYGRGMMTVHSSSAVNPAGATDATAISDVSKRTFQKDSYYMNMIDGLHRRRSVKMISDENALSWATEPLRLRYTFRNDGDLISSAQAIKVRKIANILTAIVRCEATITDTL